MEAITIRLEAIASSNKKLVGSPGCQWPRDRERSEFGNVLRGRSPSSHFAYKRGFLEIGTTNTTYKGDATLSNLNHCVVFTGRMRIDSD